MASSDAQPERWPAARVLAPRLGVALAIVLWTSAQADTLVVEHLIPWTATALPWLDEHFAVLGLRLAHSHQETVLTLRVTLAHSLFIGGQIVQTQPQGWIEVSTPAGTFLQPGVMALTLALAWPQRWWRCALGVALAGGISIALMCADLPVTLLAFVYDIFHRHYDPQGFSTLLALNDFLRSGGRLALGLLAGAGAVAAITRLTHSHAPVRTASGDATGHGSGHRNVITADQVRTGRTRA